MLTGLDGIAKLRNYKRKRFSSYDKEGENRDYITLPACETITLAKIEGSGCIKHIWITIRTDEEWYLRKIVLRMYWDNEKSPSVEVPIGDFFGIGHGITKNYVSVPLQMSPEDGKAFNCWWPMPYENGAIVTVENQGQKLVPKFYYYIDFEDWNEPPAGLGRFHACWNRQNPTDGISEEGLTNQEWMFLGKNLKGEGNYLLMEAEGKGHYVGCNVNVVNLRETDEFNWYGEGDDMIYIDDEPAPQLVGTGTEDYYCMSWCPTQEYCAPYHGLPLPGGKNWSGKVTWYRYHIQDPVYFEKSIRVTIEHGHANHRSDDYSSTAYWYQTEPHKKFRSLPSVEERIPRS